MNTYFGEITVSMNIEVQAKSKKEGENLILTSFRENVLSPIGGVEYTDGASVAVETIDINENENFLYET